MTTKKFYAKYQGRGIEDDHAYKSEDFKQFARDFRSMLREQLKDIGGYIVKFNVGHYDVSGFIKQGVRCAYFSYSVPRGQWPIDLERSDALGGILVRRARDEHDYYGGSNNFTNLAGLQTLIKACLS